jgi:hypothetical protein
MTMERTSADRKIQKPEKLLQNLIPANKYNFLNLKEILEKEIKPKEYLLYPWLPRSSICMIYAWRGRGKTFLALNIAFAVSHALEVMGWKSEKKFNVLYLDGEMDLDDLQTRLALLVKMYGLNDISENLHFLTPDEQECEMINIGSKEGQAVIDQKIIEADIDLIIVDNFSTLANGIDENNSKDWDIVQKWMLSWKRRGKAILGIHHAGKNDMQRGSSKKEDIMHTVISLKKPEGYSNNQGARFNVIFEKNRSFHGADAAPFEAWLKYDKDRPYWLTRDIEEDIESKIKKLIDAGKRPADIARELNMSKQTVNYYKNKTSENS